MIVFRGHRVYAPVNLVRVDDVFLYPYLIEFAQPDQGVFEVMESFIGSIPEYPRTMIAASITYTGQSRVQWYLQQMEPALGASPTRYSAEPYLIRPLDANEMVYAIYRDLQGQINPILVREQVKLELDPEKVGDLS